MCAGTAGVKDARLPPDPYQPQRHPPRSRPAVHRGGFPKHELARDSSVENQRLAGAERAHDCRHLRGGKSEGQTPERLAESIEPGQCDEDAAVGQGTEGEA